MIRIQHIDGPPPGVWVVFYNGESIYTGTYEEAIAKEAELWKSEKANMAEHQLVQIATKAIEEAR